jgi:hypothetical protein
MSESIKIDENIIELAERLLPHVDEGSVLYSRCERVLCEALDSGISGAGLRIFDTRNQRIEDLASKVSDLISLVRAGSTGGSSSNAGSSLSNGKTKLGVGK